jgi:hypothetical protein
VPAVALSRCRQLKTLLKRAPFGLALNDYVAGDGRARFAQACAIDLEGTVEAPESALPIGPLAALAKAENPQSPAARREALEDRGRKRR